MVMVMKERVQRTHCEDCGIELSRNERKQHRNKCTTAQCVRKRNEIPLEENRASEVKWAERSAHWHGSKDAKKFRSSRWFWR